MALISPSRRLRRTPFSDGVEAAGVRAYTVYNRMLLPTVFDSPQADYAHLKADVQVWDVACERQIELRGPDASALMQYLTPRDLRQAGEDQCCYVPIVDNAGGMLNDPVAVKLDQDRWWISIADSDLLLWVKGIAQARGLNVQVFEPDVSPLGVQGPKSEKLMARVFGAAVQDIRFFRYAKLDFAGRSLVVARSGYSKQGGFEIYVEGGDIGMPLWNALFEAGRDLNVRAGCPNLIERIEGGLLSYGNDMTAQNNPYECGLGKFCTADADFDFVGRAALARIAAEGPAQNLCPLEIGGAAVPPCDRAWPVTQGGETVGQITSAAWSPDYACNVAIGMLARDTSPEGLSVQTPDGARPVTRRARFWI